MTSKQKNAQWHKEMIAQLDEPNLQAHKAIISRLDDNQCVEYVPFEREEEAPEQRRSILSIVFHFAFNI